MKVFKYVTVVIAILALNACGGTDSLDKVVAAIKQEDIRQLWMFLDRSAHNSKLTSEEKESSLKSFEKDWKNGSGSLGEIKGLLSLGQNYNLLDETCSDSECVYTYEWMYESPDKAPSKILKSPPYQKTVKKIKFELSENKKKEGLYDFGSFKEISTFIEHDLAQYLKFYFNAKNKGTAYFISSKKLAVTDKNGASQYNATNYSSSWIHHKDRSDYIEPYTAYDVRGNTVAFSLINNTPMEVEVEVAVDFQTNGYIGKNLGDLFCMHIPSQSFYETKKLTLSPFSTASSSVYARVEKKFTLCERDKLNAALSVYHDSVKVSIRRAEFVGQELAKLPEKFQEKMEEALWLAANESQESFLFSEYLESFPQGKYVSEAKWLKVKAENELSHYAAYLQEHSEVSNKEEVIELAWKRAQLSDNIGYYNKFITLFGDSKFASDAKEKVRSHDWDKIKGEPNYSRLKLFLSKHNDGKEVEEATTQFEELKKKIAREWNELSKSDDLQSLNEFVKKYDGSKEAESASTKIKLTWFDWQARMQAAFNKLKASQKEHDQKRSQGISSYEDLGIVVWENFLKAYEEDNPYSRVDEELRTRASVWVMKLKTFKDCEGCPEMVVVPGGTFMMGRDPNFEEGKDRELPRHHVTVKSFAVGKYEVTQGEWVVIMGSNPSKFKVDRNPVEQVSWNDVQAFIRKLNEKTGQTYRLLSEAEWEYAARAGSTTAYHWGDDAGPAGQYAWFYGNANEQIHPVGQLKPNAFGLYDMAGNVSEWVEDCYHDSYQGAPTNGSSWTTGECKVRVFRGGSWNFGPSFLRSAFRSRYSPVYRDSLLGFRLARTLP